LQIPILKFYVTKQKIETECGRRPNAAGPSVAGDQMRQDFILLVYRNVVISV